MKRLTLSRVVLILLSVIVLLAIFENAKISFRARNFPTRQPNTVWCNTDGSLTMYVTGESIPNTTRYAYTMQAAWNGETYTASVGMDSSGYLLIRDGRSPHHLHLILEDHDGVVMETITCKYRMPNRYTLKLTTMDKQSNPLFPNGSLILLRKDISQVVK